MSRLAWTDPAPLEVERPKLPWWTCFPASSCWPPMPTLTSCATTSQPVAKTPLVRSRESRQHDHAVDLLDSIRAHLGVFDLPHVCSVHVVASFSGPNVTVQLARHETPEIAGTLLAWADTLTEVTAESWRVPSGDCVHLSVTGRLPDGVSLHVFGGVPFTQHGIGADLAPDARTTTPLAVLRERITLEEVTL
jgi:hypothetical protein